MNKRAIIPIFLICFLGIFCSCVTTGATPSHLYVEAEKSYKNLCDQPEKQKYRTYWLKCIDEFESVYEADEDGEFAAASLYMTGKLYRELYSVSYKKADLKKADIIFRQVAREFPKSAYRKKADKYLKDGDLAESSQYFAAKPASIDVKKPKQQKFKSSKNIPVQRDVIHEITGGETTSGEVTSSEAEENGSGNAGGPSKISSIRYWSNPEYTRIVINATSETDFINNLLKKDPSNNKLQRLYVDLKNSCLGENIQKTLPIDDTLLKDVRAGQYTPDTVRVVVDIKSFEDYNIFSLKNPFRIVIDVRGEAHAGKTAAVTPPPAAEFNSPDVSIARQLALGVRRIIIDPGHGGKDHGAPGSLRGISEKQVVLKIAGKLSEKLRRELGCEVLMTRKNDKYLTLEERTAIANTEKADLFISIHANASQHSSVYGIETYFLNLTTDNESIAVAARENATSEKNISELQTILNDLMRNTKVNESSRLATYVQGELCGQLSKNFSRINNKGVKQAPFYVLLGAQMPAILIETAFISNSRECQRLTDSKYQEKLCNGIISGIKRYIKDTRPTTFVSTEVDSGDK